MDDTWKHLDDVVSAVTLISLGVSSTIAVGVVGYLTVNGSITLSGTIPIEMIFTNVVAPLFAMLVGLALLDVYGKRRVASVLELIRGETGTDKETMKQAFGEALEEQSKDE